MMRDDETVEGRQFDGTFESYAAIRAWARAPLKDMPGFWKYEPITLGWADDIVGGRYIGHISTLKLAGGDSVLPGEWVYRHTPARGLPTFRGWHVPPEVLFPAAAKAPEPTPRVPFALELAKPSWLERLVSWFDGEGT